MSVIEHYQTIYERNKQGLPGAHLPWLQALRQQQLDYFVSHDFPNKNQETWRYINTNPLKQTVFNFSGSQYSEEWQEAGSLPDNEQKLVFVNGVYRPELSQVQEQAGVLVLPMGLALLHHADLLEPHLTRVPENSLAALNMGLFFAGAFIHVAADTNAKTAIQLLYLNEPCEKNTLANYRNVMVIDAGAKVDVVEHYQGNGELSFFNNIVTQISLAENACLRHYKVQNEKQRDYHLAQTWVTQASGSAYHSVQMNIGGLLARNDVTVDLQGEGASCDLAGLHLANDKQCLDTHATINHLVPHCQSDVLYKSLANDKSRVVFNGRVHVVKDAQKTASSMATHNRLLSNTAEIDSKPELEIYADDVKCSHGATIGELDDSLLFYLLSRGIAADEAQRLLITAFLEEVMAKVDSHYLHNHVAALLAAKQQGVSA